MEEKRIEQVKSKASLEWPELIRQLKRYTETKAYHQLLSPLRSCVKILEKKLVDYTTSNFSNDLKIIFNACKLLDGVAFEKNYREQLGSMILIPIEKSMKTQSRLYKMTVNFIKSDLPFKPYGDSKLRTLCSHEALSFIDFLKENVLIKLHDDYIGYLQKTPEVYDEAVLVIRVLDYWRVLKSNSPDEYKLSNIHPLLVMGENTLSIAQQTKLPLKSKEFWRLVLLLQILLYDHPGLLELNPSEWSENGFVLSLLEFQHYQNHLLKTTNHESMLLIDYKPRLALLRRNILQGNDILQNQHQHSEAIIHLLREKVLTINQVLGKPPCNLAVCVLGSTSRFDRRPYSDVEIMVLHSEPEKGLDIHRLKKWEAQVFVYIHYFLSVLELMIVRLGETHDLAQGGNAGFHLDSSCHVLKKKIWGTPEDMVKRFIIEASTDKTYQTHPWLDSESFYALLHPMLIHPGELEANTLIQTYREHIRSYLQTHVQPKDDIDIINSRFALTKTPNWHQGLSRQQVISMICLRDIVEKSIHAMAPDKLTEGQIVDLKKVYYKPLAYCAMNSRLYNDWPIGSPFEIFQFYGNQLPWGGEAIEAWCKAALSFVVQEQIRLHLDNAYQEEEVRYTQKTNSDKYFWACMDLIRVGFIEPLRKVIHQWFAGERTRMKDWGYNVLQSYLNSRQSWLERWVKKGLDSNRLLTRSLITELASYPDISGWSPTMTLRLSKHLKALETLFQSEDSHCQIAGLPLFERQKRYFPETLVQHCFNQDGQFVGDHKFSGLNSQVRLIEIDEKKWYIKVKEGNKEGLMGREYAVMMMHLLLGGEPQVALGWPIKLIYKKQNITKIYYAWISEAIEGENLGDVMINSPERLNKDQMDSVCFSQLFLFSYLCCPEDGQPENFKVQQTLQQKTRLIAFDYGHCFVQAETTQNSWFGSSKQVLTLKTMIFLLDSMDVAIASDFITRLRLLDVKGWFEQWKSAINNINQIFKPLLEEDLRLISDKESPKFTKLVDVDDGVLTCIKLRLELLQRWLRTRISNEKITGSKILNDLEPLVAMQYQSLRPHIKTPEDFYTKIDVKAYMKDRKSGKMVSSATFINLQQQTITPAQLQRSCDLTPSYFRQVDFTSLDKEQQEFTLRLLEATVEKKGNKFWKLNLSGCDVIKQDRLIRLLEKMPSLEILDIRNCQQLSIMTLYKLFAYSKVVCPNLKQIKMVVSSKEQTLIINLGPRERQQLKDNIKIFISSRVIFLQRLWKAIEDKNEVVRCSAKKVLGQLSHSDEEIRTTLLKTLDNENWVDRQSSVEALSESGHWDEEIRATLLNAMKDKNEFVCSSAAKALGQLGHWDEDIQTALLKDIVHESKAIRHAVVVAISQLGHWDENVRAAVLTAIKDQDEEVSSSAMDALSQLNHWDDDILKVMMEAVQSKNWKLRFAATNALGKLKYIEGVLSGLSMKSGLFSMLLQIGGSSIRAGIIVAILTHAMDDQNDMVRVAAVKALAEWDQWTHTFSYLNNVTINPEKRCSVLVAFGLLGHWNDRIREALLKALKDPENSVVRQYSAHTLGQLGHWDEDIRSALLIATKDDDHMVCGSAINALGLLGCWDEEIRAALLKAIGDKNESVRSSAVRAFGHLDRWDDEIYRALFITSRDKDIGVKMSVIEVFGKLHHRNKDMRTYLLKAAVDQKEIIRAFAVKTLGQSDHWDKDIQSVMFKAIKDYDPDVSCNVIDALARYFNLSNCEANLREQVQLLSTKDLSLFHFPENDKITKRIFFFVSDPRTQRALPCVSRKWRDLYMEFQEDQRLQAAPELGNLIVDDTDSKIQDETIQNPSNINNSNFGKKF